MEDFKVLTDRDHVLLRPNMYLGAATLEQISGIIDYKYTTISVVPALIKMIEEPLQNSIDEYIRTSGKFANKIDVTIVSTIDGVEISILDNGRGIPQDIIDGKPRAVHAWTSMRAGSNFDDATRVGAGANGVGVSLTNIFSSQFIGETCDGKGRIIVKCFDNMSTVNVLTMPKARDTTKGTRVSFIPDIERFGLPSFTDEHITVIRDRIRNLAILYPKIEFTFNGEKFHFKNVKQIAKQFDPNAVSFETENISIVIAPSGKDEEFRCLSYVNGIYIKNSGTHVDHILGKVIEDIRAHVKKKHKIDVMPNQIKQHIMIASWMSNFPALKFDSQSKERITNTVAEVSAFLSGVNYEKIAAQIVGTPEIIDPMIAAILYRKEMQERAALAKKLKGAAKVRIVNHIAATDPNPENRMLLITEGLSAIGPLIAVRDAKSVGGYPLKGKPLNVRGMKFIDIIKNKEMMELMSILGLELGKAPTDLSYGKICIFSDLDIDGEAIFSLMLNFFSLWPDLFEQKRIYRMLAPLYICVKGKQTKIFYTKEEFDTVDTKGWEVSYFKGLGSMPESVYNDCVNNPRLIQVINANDLDKLEMAFGDDASVRKTWMME
jgi:DNA topoisomerase-2